VERVTLVYVARGSGKNIFTTDNLETIHRIEKDIADMPAYKELCYLGVCKYYVFFFTIIFLHILGTFLFVFKEVISF